VSVQVYLIEILAGGLDQTDLRAELGVDRREYLLTATTGEAFDDDAEATAIAHR
jgi:hypothetical protein